MYLLHDMAIISPEEEEKDIYFVNYICLFVYFFVYCCWYTYTSWDLVVSCRRFIEGGMKNKEAPGQVNCLASGTTLMLEILYLHFLVPWIVGVEESGRREVGICLEQCFQVPNIIKLWIFMSLTLEGRGGIIYDRCCFNGYSFLTLSTLLEWWKKEIFWLL